MREKQKKNHKITSVGIPRCNTTNALPKSPRHNLVLKNRSRAQKLFACCAAKLEIGHSDSLITVRKVVFISSFGAGLATSSVIPKPDTIPSSFSRGTLIFVNGNAIGLRLAVKKKLKLKCILPNL